MNNLITLARFGGGRGSAAVLFVVVLAVLAVAIFAGTRGSGNHDAPVEKK